MQASVVVPTRNRAARLDSCLAGLARQTFPADAFEILVIDNGSSDDTPQCIERWAGRRPGLRRVDAPVPGVSVARNAGIAEAGTDVLAFIDDDAVPEPAWLETLLGAYTRWPGVGAACGRARLRLERPRPAWFGTETESWFSAMDFGSEPRLLLKADEVPWSINLSVRTAIAREVGGFPEDLGRVGATLRSGEEFPFIGGIRRTGARIAYEPDAVVWHAVPAERLRMRWLMRRAWAEGRMAVALARATETEPLDALHATAHVTLRGWGPFVKQLRSPLPTSEVLVSELTKRVAGVGRVWARVAESRTKTPRS